MAHRAAQDKPIHAFDHDHRQPETRNFNAANQATGRGRRPDSRGRKNVSRCPEIPTLPGCPGSAVPGIWPTERRKITLSTPSTTITESPRRGISMRPIRPPAAAGGLIPEEVVEDEA